MTCTRVKEENKESSKINTKRNYLCYRGVEREIGINLVLVMMLVIMLCCESEGKVKGRCV